LLRLSLRLLRTVTTTLLSPFWQGVREDFRVEVDLTGATVYVEVREPNIAGETARWYILETDAEVSDEDKTVVFKRTPDADPEPAMVSVVTLKSRRGEWAEFRE
jgi:hypothetical protein